MSFRRLLIELWIKVHKFQSCEEIESNRRFEFVGNRKFEVYYNFGGTR